MNTWIEIQAGAQGEMLTKGGGYCQFKWGDDVLLQATRIEDGYVYLLSDSVRFPTNRVTVKA